MDHDTYLDIVRTDSATLIDVGLEHLDTDIEFLPEWQVRDLLAHVGGVFSTVLAIFDAGGERPGPLGDEAAAPDGDAIGAWVRERRSTLIERLESTDPGTPTWTFSGAGTADYWARRMAHECAVHRWDVQAAVGEPDPIDSDLGTDAIDEYAEVSLRFSQRYPDRVYPAETLHLHRTDGPGEWMFARGESPNEVVVTHEHGKGDAAVRGPGGDLSLWIRGRPVSGLEMFGDEAVAAAWQALSP